MSISRRSLLQYAGAGCALAQMPTVMAKPMWRRYEVVDTVALPRFAPGAQLLADTAIGAFTTDGLYLYPAWGQPRLYEVRRGADRLQFHNPGTGQLLWTQSASYAAGFAGRVLDAAPAAVAASWPELDVPARPR